MSELGPNALRMVGEFIRSIPDSWDTAQQVEDAFNDKSLSDTLFGEIVQEIDNRLITEGNAIVAYAGMLIKRKNMREQAIKQFAMDVSAAKNAKEVARLIKAFNKELLEIDKA